MVKLTVKEGNQCLFLVFAFTNFMVFLSSLGILSCAIYLFFATKSANHLNLFFLAAALTLLFLTMCSFKLRRSIHLLRCYLFI